MQKPLSRVECALCLLVGLSTLIVVAAIHYRVSCKAPDGAFDHRCEWQLRETVNPVGKFPPMAYRE